jgi:hypothetical protein
MDALARLEGMPKAQVLQLVCASFDEVVQPDF